MNSMISKAKRRLFIAAAILLAFVASLIIVELTLQVLRWWVLQKNISHVQRIGEKDTIILSLGESTTYGLGVAEEDSYSSLVENALNGLGDGRRYRVLNLGWHGAISDNVRDVYDLAMERFEVAAVVVNIGHNDLLFQSNYKARGEKRDGPSVFSIEEGDEAVNAERAHGLMLPRVCRTIFHKFGDNKSLGTDGGFWQANTDRGGNPRIAFHDVGTPIPKGWFLRVEREIVSNLKDNVAHISDTCRRRRIPMVFLGYMRSLSNRYLRKIADDVRMNFVDIAISNHELYEQHVIRRRWHGTEDGFHPNERGHSKIARSVLRKLQQIRAFDVEEGDSKDR